MHPMRSAVAVLALASVACAQSTLDSLLTVSGARSARVSSAAPEDWSNRDNRWLKPGETITLADLTGPGVVRHIWLTFADAAPGWLSKEGSADPSEMVLRCYWDDGVASGVPAVESPVGDFFAAGFGIRAEVISDPIQVADGDSYNSYWPMPFFKHAKITITNQSDKPLAALYYQVDYTREPAGTLAATTPYFCAQYRQEFPTTLGREYLIADIRGAGHYVGTVMSVRSRSPQWFGEGDEKFFIDGETTPSLWGTGTEDYFANAWGMHKGCFPSFGVTILDGWLGDLGQKGTMYRWHIADPVRFTRSLRFTIEHNGWMSADETTTGNVEGHVEREDDFATVAFWYQQGQPARFTTLPSAKERKLPSIDDVTDGATLLSHARAENGQVSLQAGALWTPPGQVFFDAAAVGSSLELVFDVPADGTRRLIVPITRSYDFGVYRVLLDQKPHGQPLDLYSPTVELQELDLGDLPLAAGSHTLRFECIDRNPRSTGFKLGVDSVRFRHRWNTKRPPLGPKPK